MAGTSGALSSAKLAVTGMTCGSCARHVTEALNALDGVDAAQVDLQAGCATVSFDPAVATPEQMLAAVEGAGYGASLAPAKQSTLAVVSGCGSSCCAP